MDNTQSLHLIAIQGYHDSEKDMIESSRQQLADTISSTQSTLEARLRGMGINFMCNAWVDRLILLGYLPKILHIPYLS